MARSKNILTEEKENFDLEKYIAIYPSFEAKAPAFMPGMKRA